MERLWTPWRMAYIKGEERHAGCVFCDLPAAGEEHDPSNLILARGTRAFVIMNKFPYNTGHVMVAPTRHVAGWEELDAEELTEVSAWSQRVIGALKRALGPEGFNIGINQGVTAGAGIADHVHLHVVPRWGGDTNFMMSVGDTKVLPESLDDTYARLRPLLTES